ncbi:hypothetical protein EAO73_27495 [Streptomyces sp. col6]|nr:hypothetical protein EAO73_27495 [Streptomyces sp. col6]
MTEPRLNALPLVQGRQLIFVQQISQSFIVGMALHIQLAIPIQEGTPPPGAWVPQLWEDACSGHIGSSSVRACWSGRSRGRGISVLGAGSGGVSAMRNRTLCGAAGT